jgi:hypothetical protein
MTAPLATCPHCGAVLLWVHGTLACARRDCGTRGTPGLTAPVSVTGETPAPCASGPGGAAPRGSRMPPMAFREARHER